MRSRGLFVALLLTVTQGNPGRADLSHSESPPFFSAADQQIIKRNATLSQLVKRDPWLVKQVLQAIAAPPRQAPETGGRQGMTRERGAVAPVSDRDPDLQQLERSSPEAAHDLFQLIKKAIAGKK
jgi:hypothetical protein